MVIMKGWADVQNGEKCVREVVQRGRAAQQGAEVRVRMHHTAGSIYIMKTNLCLTKLCLGDYLD